MLRASCAQRRRAAGRAHGDLSDTIGVRMLAGRRGDLRGLFTAARCEGMLELSPAGGSGSGLGVNFWRGWLDFLPSRRRGELQCKEKEDREA